MKHLALAMLFYTAIFSNRASADDAARVEAEKLLDIINVQATLDQAVNVMLDAQLKQNPDIVPYKNVMLEFLDKHMSYEALKPELIAIYSTEFSASELFQIRTFYSTPVGQKYIARLPTLISKSAELGGKSVEDNLSELEQMIENEMARLKDSKKSTVSADISKADARNLFEQYQEKGKRFDPTLAELYCENGAIQMFREDASGAVRKIEGPIPPFKKIVLEGMQEAKRTNDYSKFSKVTYHPDGDNIRIESTRYSVLRKYKSPATFVVGKCASGEIGILLMIVHSKPAAN